MKNRILFLTALILLLAFCLQGCGLLINAYRELLTVPVRPDYSDGAVAYTDYVRPYSPRVEPVSFSQMQYERPDAEALCRSLTEAGALAAEASEDAVLEQYLPAYDA